MAQNAQIAQHLEPIADGPEFEKSLVSYVCVAILGLRGWSTAQHVAAVSIIQ